MDVKVVFETGEVTTHPKKLLAVAEQLLTAGEFSISVVVAHIACEVATDRAFTDAYRKRGLEYLEDAVESLSRGNNLANHKKRQLYTALTGDPIAQQVFWKHFVESVGRRNRISHRGAIMNRKEAEESLGVARKVVAYLEARYLGQGLSK